MWEQQGFPSLIDYGALSGNLIADNFIDWHGMPSYHALLGCVLKASAKSFRQMPKINCSCTADAEFLQALSRYEFASDEEPQGLADGLSSVQKVRSDFRSCRQQHFGQIPMQLRDAYHLAKEPVSQACADMWRKLSWDLRKH